ncbi:MAG: DNA polymerase III subunit gamma/tau [Candidatus Aminicenantes bacterium]|nr:DNA polymerase III subunit gamma/tau [Candidatus Aminicenantes bacterium]NIM81430.1 DNA polymerase III subunit gamma/tau [Candidatus Aminicenantes bacterium]NIN23155.1 DNA polymerase III subunit gamma/tau [Candidatus Aminicenantes bacterium]NIN44616.1 DNA polymerase III subunit gamma/tau [Candidatus Aminicenantes bacterium]NIN87432.1 DNA polymerase III subunit gamma/tau [Candidatus Aminicenantes bacterium]
MYLALARKYRPQKFVDLIGQPHVTKTLQNAISMDKLYSSLIFSGMKGVGKTSAARILSKALNCENGPAIEPCNQCPICIEITEDKSPDYIEIDGASNNGVEEVRSLKEKVRYKPIKNRFRVVVIDEVHMLSTSAWNALLKTIEEPPPHTYFIMATTGFHKIPATIVSRCQHFEFKRIPQEVVAKVLKDICSKENIKINDYSLYLLAKASEGSLRDAKKILDQAIALSSGEVQDKDVIDILGVIEEEIFITLTKNVLTKNRKAIIQQINELAERGMDLRFFYNEYLKFFRDLMVLKSLEESQKLHNLNPENIPVIKEMLTNIREIELLRYFNAAKDLEQTIRNTENPRIILEYLFLKLSYFPSLMSIEDLIHKTKTNTRTKSTELPGMNVNRSEGLVNISVSSGLPADGEEVPPVSNERVDLKDPNLRTVLIETVEKDNSRLASNLGSSSFALKDNTLFIEFPGNMEFAYKNTIDQIDYLKEVISRIMKQEVKVVITMDQNSRSEEEARRKELENDPKINRLADKIKGKISSVEKI